MGIIKAIQILLRIAFIKKLYILFDIKTFLNDKLNL